MTDNRQSSAAARYVVTPAGHQALSEPEKCSCQLNWSGLILECPLCGTVYGIYRDQELIGRGRAF